MILSADFLRCVRSRLLGSALAGATLLGATLATPGCQGSTPLDAFCDLQEKCASDEQWRFSLTECKRTARIAFEEAENAGCIADFEEYAACVDEIDLQCDEDYPSTIAKHCEKESRRYTKCLADADEDESKTKEKSRNGNASSSGSPRGDDAGTNTGPAPTTGTTMHDFCRHADGCDLLQGSLDSCLQQADAEGAQVDARGCDAQQDAAYECAVGLSCNDLPGFESSCNSEFSAFQSCMGG